MTQLKRKIKTINSLPDEEKKKVSPITLLIVLIILIILGLLSYFIYKRLLPYINAVNVNNIVGKKTYITKCNTKDYIIIGKDKSYSLSLTNNNCEIKHYEGNIIIKNNEVTFNNNIKGYIDNNYNIIINNNTFEDFENE